METTLEPFVRTGDKIPDKTFLEGRDPHRGRAWNLTPYSQDFYYLTSCAKGYYGPYDTYEEAAEAHKSATTEKWRYR